MSHILTETKFKEIYNLLERVGIVGECKPYPAGKTSFYRYFCERKSPSLSIKTGYGFGASENKLQAKMHSVAEAVERFSILNIRKDMLIHGTYEELKPEAVDPKLFQNFINEQLASDKYKDFRFNSKTKFNWIKGKSIIDGKSMLIPAQLVYAEYDTKKEKEPLIRFSNSAGAACSTDINTAILTGLCELIERDNYLINFLNRVTPKAIDINKSNKFKDLIEEANKLNLNLYCLDISLDFGLIVVAVILIDKSGKGPAVNIGLACDSDVEHAISHAGMEALSVYMSKKQIYFNNNNAFRTDSDEDWEKLQKRFFWNSYINIEKINFFISGKKEPFEIRRKQQTSLNSLIKQLRKKNYNAFYVDLTLGEIKSSGLSVVRVLVPEFYPFSNFDSYPYKKNERLYSLLVDMKILKNMTSDKKIFWSNPL